jgi:predicted ester cyclase
VTASDANKHVVLRYVAAFNAADYDTLRHVFAGDAVIQGVLGQGGLEFAVPIWKELHHAFALRLTVEEIIAEGEVVAVRYTERGTFNHSFRGQSPTGKSYELVAMEWFLLRDGKIKQRWAARDAAAQARQIGLTLQESSLRYATTHLQTDADHRRREQT